MLRCAGVALAVLVLAALAPGRPGAAGARWTGAPIPDEHAVRVRCDGRVVVYDKRDGYVVAELAERWPSVVGRVFPGDRIEVDGVLHDVRADVRWPWWR